MKKLKINGGALKLTNTDNRPDIKQTIISLREAMNADNDQILEEEFEGSIYPNYEEEYCDDEDESDGDVEFVFSSDDILYEEIYENNGKSVNLDDVFVLSKLIQDDGTILNLKVEQKTYERPSIKISDDRIEEIIREEAKPIIRDWVSKNMPQLFRK